MAHLMIVNPKAGKGRGAETAERAVALFKNRGIEIEMQVSGYQGHAVSLSREIDQTSTEGVIAVGGDGTLFEVINGLMGAGDSISVPVGQIPVGTGNSFIKDLEIKTIEDAVERVASGSTRNVDAGRFTCAEGTYSFVNLLGAGFVSNVAYTAGRYKRFGAFSYVLGVFQELIGLKPCPSRLVIDGKVIERDLIFVEICNSRYTGGNMMMAPSAAIDDGVLDVVVISAITRRKLLNLFPRIFDGSHVEDDSVEVFRGAHILVESERPLALAPDGETFGQTPIEVKLLPAALKMCC